MSIIRNELRNKKDLLKKIDEKVSNEQIVPTQTEKKTLQDIIRSISSQFSKELTDPNIDKEILNEKIRKAIEKEISQMDVEYEKRKRIEKLAIDNIIGLGPLQQRA